MLHPCTVDLAGIQIHFGGYYACRSESDWLWFGAGGKYRPEFTAKIVWEGTLWGVAVLDCSGDKLLGIHGCWRHSRNSPFGQCCGKVVKAELLSVPSLEVVSALRWPAASGTRQYKLLSSWSRPLTTQLKVVHRLTQPCPCGSAPSKVGHTFLTKLRESASWLA